MNRKVWGTVNAIKRFISTRHLEPGPDVSPGDDAEGHKTH
jgi:hypothetical protein